MTRETTQQPKESTKNTTNRAERQSSTGNGDNESRSTAMQNVSGDRERNISTARDGSSRETGTGLTRRDWNAPTWAGGSSPFSLMRRMSEDMDRLFEQFGFGRTGFGLSPAFGGLTDTNRWPSSFAPWTTDQGLWSPQVETFRRGDKLVVRADLPAVKKEDLHVEVENDVLTVSGERREEREENEDGFYRSERSYGHFRRSIPLPEGVNADQVEASFKDGVLEVTLPAPKQVQRQARRIQIR